MRSLLQTSEKKSSVDSSRSEQQAAVVVVGTQEAKEPLSLRKSTSSGRWCNMDVEEVAAILLTNTERGLYPEEASERLRIGGFNELPVTKSKAFLRALFSNTFNPMNGILLLALVFCFAVQDVINAAVLLIVMLSNSIIGFIQEYRCENTMEALKSVSIE